jgi:hypothetical protein
VDTWVIETLVATRRFYCIFLLSCIAVMVAWKVVAVTVLWLQCVRQSAPLVLELRFVS